MSAGGDSAVRRAQRRVGTSVRDKYRVERVLGVGGMATVYLGVHRNGHKVALKVLNPELASDDDIRARFVREGYAANAIEHRGVVRVLDDDVTEDGAPFLVMELLDGETLQGRMMRAGGKLGAREVLALAHQILDVVEAAHARGVLHRDLKPDNLFLTREGMVKVLDFGVARIAIPESGSDPTRTGRTMGTPAFMAPEQAFGKTREVDARSDLWSVGATMFTLLSGQHVHDAENAAQLLILAATLTARSLAAVAPDTPPAVVAIVDKACAFERAARYASAREMRDAVAEAHRALFGGEVTASLVTASLDRITASSAPTMDVASPSLASAPPPPAPPLATRAPPSKRRVAIALGLGGIAVALALGGAALSRVRREAPPVRAALDVVPESTGAGRAARAACACGAGSICRAGACVALASPECEVLARPGDVANERTVWIGAMFAARGPMAGSFDGARRDMELARRDFLEVASGLPPLRAGEPPRPIGVVSCDDSAEPERVARHLAEDLGLPAIVGFSRSKEVADLAASVLHPLRVAAFASNTADMLAALVPPGGERLVWRTTLSSSMRVPVMAAVVRDVIEPDLRARGLVAPGEAVRVALVNIDNATGVSVSDAVATSLRFNGKSITENGDDFFAVVTHDGKDDRDEARRVAPLVASFRPHVVFDAGSNGAIVAALEAVWTGAPRPRYVLGTASDDLDRVQDPTIGARMLDVDTRGDAPAAAKFEMRYASVFDPGSTPTETVTGGPYDAFYALAYAIAALGDAPVTGPAIGRALPRLAGPGPRVDVGPGGIVLATSTLARGGSIDLEGTTSSLDFDPATGDPTVDMAITCVKPGRDGVQHFESGLAWDRRARAITGTSRCK